jgi:hypothetical protein
MALVFGSECGNMTFKQKIRLVRVMLVNLYWSLKSERYALKLLADSSVGFYLRQVDPELYREYYCTYTGHSEQTIDSLLENKNGSNGV